MTLKFSTYFILLTLLFSCKENDKIDLDKLVREKIEFNQVPDTVKKIFYSHVGPKTIVNGRDTTYIYPNTDYDLIYIDACKTKTELKSIPWIISSWFDHYELVINGKSLMTTKNLEPPFIIFHQKLFTSDLSNIVDTSEYKTSDVNVINLTERLNVCE